MLYSYNSRGVNIYHIITDEVCLFLLQRKYIISIVVTCSTLLEWTVLVQYIRSGFSTLVWQF